jgi:NAD-dependent SIR2 family protein deacetylase
MTIPRVKESHVAKLQELSDIIAGAKKIVAITGAGISTSCGIPVGEADQRGISPR